MGLEDPSIEGGEKGRRRGAGSASESKRASAVPPRGAEQALAAGYRSRPGPSRRRALPPPRGAECSVEASLRLDMEFRERIGEKVDEAAHPHRQLMAMGVDGVDVRLR